MNKELIIKKSILVNADSSAVWEALTNPALTKVYFLGCEVISEWKVGRSIIYRDNTEETPVVHVDGILKHYEEGKMFEYACRIPLRKADGTPGDMIRVSFELEDGNGKIRVTLTQDCGGNEQIYNNSDAGWDFVLHGLKNLVEKSK